MIDQKISVDVVWPWKSSEHFQKIALVKTVEIVEVSYLNLSVGGCFWPKSIEKSYFYDFLTVITMNVWPARAVIF